MPFPVSVLQRAGVGTKISKTMTIAERKQKEMMDYFISIAKKEEQYPQPTRWGNIIACGCRFSKPDFDHFVKRAEEYIKRKQAIETEKDYSMKNAHTYKCKCIEDEFYRWANELMLAMMEKSAQEHS